MGIKKILGLGILVVGLSSGSCSKDKVDADVPDNIEGEWVLTRVHCFCFFDVDHDFSTHELRFPGNVRKVIVTNDSERWYLAPAAEYPYTMVGDTIAIDGTDYTITTEDDQLWLQYQDNPQIADDEIVYFYSRK